MSIYRPRRSRWPLLVVLSVAGLGIGFVLGALVMGARDPDLEAAAVQVQRGLSDSAALLEVVGIEYAEAMSGGARTTEVEGALAALARSEERYRGVAAALAVLDASRAQEVEHRYEELTALVAGGASEPEVAKALAALTARLRGR